MCFHVCCETGINVARLHRVQSSFVTLQQKFSLTITSLNYARSTTNICRIILNVNFTPSVIDFLNVKFIAFEEFELIIYIIINSNLAFVVSTRDIMTLSDVIASIKQTWFDPTSANVNVLVECDPPFWYIDGTLVVQCGRSMPLNGAISWVHRPLNGAYDLIAWWLLIIVPIYIFRLLLDGFTSANAMSIVSWSLPACYILFRNRVPTYDSRTYILFFITRYLKKLNYELILLEIRWLQLVVVETLNDTHFFQKFLWQ